MPTSKDPILRQRQFANLSRNGRPPGHGLQSKRIMVPLRQQAEAWARDRWPWLDDTRIHLVSDLAARVERVRVWSDENDILIGRSQRVTRAHPVVDSADRWAQRLDGMIDKLDAEAAAREKPESIIAGWHRQRQLAEGNHD
jgi:hypothetical protein